MGLTPGCLWHFFAPAESLYDVLGVTESANEREIKRAYRQKALKLHPDVNKAVRGADSCACSCTASLAAQALLLLCETPYAVHALGQLNHSMMQQPMDTPS